MSVSLALDILMRKRKMLSEEVILPRDRAECLVNALVELLKIQSMDSIKLRVDDDKITIVPLCRAVEMKR